MTHRRLKDFLMIALILTAWATLVALSVHAQRLHVDYFSHGAILYADSDVDSLRFEVASDAERPAFYPASIDGSQVDPGWEGEGTRVYYPEDRPQLWSGITIEMQPRHEFLGYVRLSGDASARVLTNAFVDGEPLHRPPDGLRWGARRPELLNHWARTPEEIVDDFIIIIEEYQDVIESLEAAIDYPHEAALRDARAILNRIQEATQ